MIVLKRLFERSRWGNPPFPKQSLWSVREIVVHLEDHVQTAISYNLPMKEGSLLCYVLFCSYEIHRTRMLQMVKVLHKEGCMGLVP
jgi:hypothetical protein